MREDSRGGSSQTYEGSSSGSWSMTFRVNILPQARVDIARNADWWAAHHSVEQAIRRTDTIYDQIETLGDFPENNLPPMTGLFR